MDQLNSNLISGVVADEAPDSFSPPSTQVPVDGVSPAVDENPTPADSGEELLKTFIDKAVDRLSDELKRAEQRGFDRAMEQARANALGLADRANSCPNFLVDVRPDIWSPEACRQ